jgi:uncharacterized protein YjbI with pentapeptide repeats
MSSAVFFLVALCLAAALTTAAVHARRRRKRWRPVHPADDLVRTSRTTIGGMASCSPESTPLGNSLVLLTIPPTSIQRRMSMCGDTSQVATTFFVQAYGNEDDFEVTYEGSYHLTKATKDALANKHIYLREFNSAVVITDRQLGEEPGYSFLGRLDPVYYASGLCAMLKWDPLMMNDDVLSNDGSEGFKEVLELLGQGRSVARKGPKRGVPRLSDADFEAEFRRVKSGVERKKQADQLADHIARSVGVPNDDPLPHRPTLRYPMKGAREASFASGGYVRKRGHIQENSHLYIVQQGVAEWNRWRKNNPHVTPDLRRTDMDGLNLYLYDLSAADLTDARLTGSFLHSANLTKATLTSADLCEVNLCNANLTGADLTDAKLEAADISIGAILKGAILDNADLSYTDLVGSDLRGASLTYAKLFEAKLSFAQLQGANLSGARLDEADLSQADLAGAKLVGATLRSTILTDANLEGADLSGSFVYGVATWNAKLTGAIQKDLVITTDDEPQITVDNLEVAEFVYRLLKNEKFRGVMDTVAEKVVLILGRFSSERKPTLTTIKTALRQHNLVPIIFDFEKPHNRTTLETVTTIAKISRFVIADLTDARSVLLELGAIVPANPSIPIKPLLLESQDVPGMWDSIAEYPWVLNIYRYSSTNELEENLNKQVLEPVGRFIEEMKHRRSRSR